jgi:hypothetical protein
MKCLQKFLMIFAFTALLVSCRKESFTDSSSARLTTSVDTLYFDTVFTSTGSTSQIVKIYNDNEKGIHISSVKLAGGAASPFKINVDGFPGPLINNLDLASGDSMYIFVTVTINPTAANLPFILQDSIEIEWNGNRKFVQLDAYGQNAHFLKGVIYKNNTTWINDLPYVILGGIIVDTNATLTINKGIRVHMHADAPFIVNGTLNAVGEKYDSTRIVFTGDRLDEPYRSYPASYPGIFFTASSQNNLLEYVTVKNAYQGIVATDLSPGIKLTMRQCIIDNAYDIGLAGVNTSITAENVLISNCGKNLVLVKGGNYNFKHVTSASFSNAFIQHRNPVAVVSNYTTQNGTAFANNLTASFTNCIFWGEANGVVNDEVVVLRHPGTAYTVNFDQILWRVQTQPATVSGVTVTGAINNIYPAFDSVNNSKRFYDFRLKAASPALNKGITTSVNVDLNGLPRPVGLPDLGAYERQ